MQKKQIRNMAWSITDGQMLLVEVTPPFTRMVVQFPPNEVSNPRNANHDQIQVVGSNDPLLHFNGGSEQLNFELSFYSDDENRKDVIDKIDWLKSLTFNNGFEAGQPRIKIVAGEFFAEEVWVVSQCTPKYSLLDSEHGWLPIQAVCSITLLLDVTSNRKMSDIRKA